MALRSNEDEYADVRSETFTAAHARAIAEAASYKLQSEPKAHKKHYVVEAAKSGAILTIDVHRDGHIVEKGGDASDFTAAHAREIAESAGYKLHGAPQARKKHYVVEAAKNGAMLTIDVHRDGHIVEKGGDASDFTAAQARKLAEAAGYKLQSEPEAHKKHFVVEAEKHGAVLTIDVHRDGHIVEKGGGHSDFSAAQARKLAESAGYKLHGAPEAHKKHFIVEAEKNGAILTIDVHRDGRIVEKAF